MFFSHHPFLWFPYISSFSDGERLVLLCLYIAKMRIHGNFSKLACKVPGVLGWRAREFSVGVMREWKRSEFLGAFPNPS